MHHSLVTVPAASAAAMLYARFVSSSVRPGLRRLIALSPALALLLVLPLAIPAYSARGAATFILVWLGEFKLLLLASGRGPLDPALPPLHFVFAGALPVNLLLPVKCADDDDSASAAPPHVVASKSTSTTTAAALPLVSASVKLAAVAAIVRALQDKDRMHLYAAFTLYGVITYCVLDFALPCLAALCRATLRADLEPQFDRPYLSASLGDFWGRRWNLVVPAVLRPSVYIPVRASLGSAPAAVLAVFLVSGLMHEVVVWYLAFRPPTGRVTAFFVLHGVSVCLERSCARRCTATVVPRVVAAPLVVAYVAATAFWLFFPPLFGGGTDDHFIAEFSAVMSFLTDAGRRLLCLR